MALKTKKLSLAQKICSLVTVTPKIFGSDDENEETKAKLVENYEETDSNEGPAESTFRKRNVDLLDQIDNRYKGKKFTRKDIYDENEDKINKDESSNSKDEDSEEENLRENRELNSEDQNVESAEDEEISSDSRESNSDVDEDSEIDENNPLRRECREGDLRHVQPRNNCVDVEKGNCVREQLKIWENLLEIRIKLQKCLIAGNKMPQLELYQKLKKTDGRFERDAKDGKKEFSKLLENLLEMQKSFFDNYPETRNLTTMKGEKRQDVEDGTDEEIASDTDMEFDKEEKNETGEDETRPTKKKKRKSLDEYEKILADNHDTYRDYRNSVIQKWNDKTRVASGSLNKSANRAIVKQIEFVLSDRSKLLEKTRLKRSEYVILGKEGSSQDNDGRRIQDYDSEIYDDDDFYHQLLRELIEYKSSDITDPVQLSKQWIALQNMRTKMKRKIDTRATKGRRVRYNVHTKLVNFMAPININDEWSDLAKNELYNSLFGKIKSIDNEKSDDK